MIAKVAIVLLVVARSERRFLRLAEVHVGEVDEVPVLVVAGIVHEVAVGLVRDVALLPRGHLRFDLRDVGAGFHLHEDVAGLAAPALVRNVGWSA